jgi:hypothetical protein
MEDLCRLQYMFLFTDVDITNKQDWILGNDLN